MTKKLWILSQEETDGGPAERVAASASRSASDTDPTCMGQLSFPHSPKAVALLGALDSQWMQS